MYGRRGEDSVKLCLAEVFGGTMGKVFGTKTKEFIQSGLSFFRALSQKIEEKLNPLVQRADEYLGKQITPSRRMITLLVIKYLYVFLTVAVLKDQWYIGYGSYGIDFVFWKELLALPVFLLVCAAYIQLKFKDQFIDYTLYFLLVIYYIPLNSAFAINNQPLLYFLCSNLFFMLILVATYYGAGFLRKFSKEDNKLFQHKAEYFYNDRNVIAVCMLICGLFIVYKLCYNGLSFSISIDGNDVYGTRAEYVEFLDSISGTPFSYLLSILRNVAPYAALYYLLIALITHKWIHVLFGTLCILAQFSVSSGKGLLIYLAIIAVLYMMQKLKILKHFKRIFEIGMLTLLTVCLMEHLLLHSDRIFTLLIRRVLYYPAWLSTMYYEFFTENGPVLWTQNVFLLQNLLQPVYDTSPLTLISETYFAGLVPSPNSGLFAEAVMHFGVVGTMIYPVLLAAVLLISGKILKSYGICVQIFMATRLAINLQNVPITRTDSVLSYFLFVFMLWILPKLHIRNLPEGIQERLIKRKN